jgi:hypothetical protein
MYDFVKKIPTTKLIVGLVIEQMRLVMRQSDGKFVAAIEAELHSRGVDDFLPLTELMGLVQVVQGPDVDLTPCSAPRNVEQREKDEFFTMESKRAAKDVLRKVMG